MMKIWLEARDSDAGKPTEASTDDCTDNDECEGNYTTIVSADHLPSENEIYPNALCWDRSLIRPVSPRHINIRVG
ncbi:MAG: hypothetical protein NVS2B12_18970 [Ktedonobacteraceae bacterium]